MFLIFRLIPIYLRRRSSPFCAMSPRRQHALLIDGSRDLIASRRFDDLVREAQILTSGH